MVDQQIDIPVDYQVRINRVFEYIDNNLATELSLVIIADIAFFSPFHFHRIFKKITGETLNEYITRKRIEKAALELIHKNIAVSNICHKYGFNDNSSFARAFKKFYGVSPSEFRKQNPNKFSKIRQLKSKNGQTYPNREQYLCTLNNLKNWIQMNATIEIREIQKMELAGVPAIGHNNIAAAYQKLMRWAAPLGLLNENTKMLTVYHDSFKVTEADKVRTEACIVLNQPVKPTGEVKLDTIAKGKFIVGSFEIVLDDFEKSWTGLFIWMNENGYKKADRNIFELYHNNFNDHPEKKAIVDFYIPIE